MSPSILTRQACDEPNLPIFVYGTLKRGEVRERCWPHAASQVEAATLRGRLYDLGPYPALVEGDQTVAGELWYLADEDLAETLRVLDEIECFGNLHVDLYVRRVAECRIASGEIRQAYTYFFANPNQLAAFPVVEPNAAGLCAWQGGKASG